MRKYDTKIQKLGLASYSFLWWSLLLLIPSNGNALNPLEIKGYKFFDSVTEEEVTIRGIDYYPRPNKGELNFNSIDYYTEDHRHIWERDIPYFEELGVNAIRLYAVDAQQDHHAFMCALEQAGIYAIVALAHDCPTCAVTRDESPDCYPIELKEQGQTVINEFARYSNTMAFSAGNEVNHFAPSGQPEHNAPCQKKFIRDMREYVNSCSGSRHHGSMMRKIPVGLVAADSDRMANTLYYNCQSDPDDEFDFAEWFGLNSYVTCDGTAETYDEALGFKALQQSFESYNYSIPVLLTEFGCLSENFPTVDDYASQRTFLQAQWLMEREDLRNVFAGGFAFEYSIEMANAGSESSYPFTTFGKQNYGIGYFGPENCDDVTIPCIYHPMPSFEFLQQAYQANTSSSNGTSTTMVTFQIPASRTKRSTCPKQFPSILDFEWEADTVPFGTCPTYKTKPLKGNVCTASSIPSSSSKNKNHYSVLFVLLVVFSGIFFFLASFYNKNNYTDEDDDSFDSHDDGKYMSKLSRQLSKCYREWKKWWKNRFNHFGKKTKHQELVTVWSDDEASSDESTGLLAAGARGGVSSSSPQEVKTRYVRDDIKSIYLSVTSSDDTSVA